MKNLISILLSLSFLIPALSFAQTSDYMKPQPLPFFGPWFEGWYIRVVDSKNGISFATITTSSTHENEFLLNKTKLPGYKAFIYAPKLPIDAFSVEEFPKSTELVRGFLPQSDLWRAQGGSLLSKTGLDLRMNESSIRVQIEFGKHTPWNKNDINWGPAGIAGYIPALPLQWFVVSIKTPVSYRITQADGSLVNGVGLAHIEKNWGKTFPKAWMWLQGFSKDGNHQLAIAGGPLELGPATITAFLVGVRSPNLSVDINPAQGPQVSYKTWSDPCNGKFKLRASNLRYRVEVSAEAAIDSFVPLAIPTKNGYLPDLAQESFYSKILVKVWEFGKLIYTHQYQSSALEFGADYICQ